MQREGRVVNGIIRYKHKSDPDNPCGRRYSSQAKWQNPACIGGQSDGAARQIGDVLERIPHSTYVEPMVGVGNVFAKIRIEPKPGYKMVINDIDCTRLKEAKRRRCKSPDTLQCRRFHAARRTCRRSWRTFLRLDGKTVLFYLDPPYEFPRTSKKAVLKYKHNDVKLQELVDAAKRLKGSVAISSSDMPQSKKILCRAPFRCQKIIKNNPQGVKYTELLAVKRAR